MLNIVVLTEKLELSAYSMYVLYITNITFHNSLSAIIYHDAKTNFLRSDSCQTYMELQDQKLPGVNVSRRLFLELTIFE